MSIDFNDIKKAVQNRDDFLRQNPELLTFQEKINQGLSQVGDDIKKRNIFLQQLMLETWFQITKF